MDELVGTYVAGQTGDLDSDDYAAITAEAEVAFPDHGLSYLVTYGVYGLASAKAAE
jgi:hypothetical protein